MTAVFPRLGLGRMSLVGIRMGKVSVNVNAKGIGIGIGMMMGTRTRIGIPKEGGKGRRSPR